MIIGLPCYAERLATLFDTASDFSLHKVDGADVSHIYPVGRLSLPHNDPTKKITALAAHGVTLVICGGISQGALRCLHNADIECRPWICGEIEAVLQAFCDNSLDTLLMPGCRARQGLCPGGGGGRRMRGKTGTCCNSQHGRRGLGGHNGGNQ